MPALESCTHGYASGSLHLVTGKHPDLYSGTSQALNRQSHFILELVLDACNAQ